MFLNLRASVFTFIILAQSFAPMAMAQPGSPDLSFGSAGRVQVAPYSSFDFHAMDVAQEASGALIVAGLANDPSGAFSENGFVLRLQTNGQLDSTFNGGAGFFLAWFDWVDTLPTADRIEALAIQSDGKIVIAGSTNVEGSEDMLIMRLHANGQVDSSFNNGLGYLILEFDLNGGGDDFALDVAIDSNGKIVLAGGASWNGSDTDIAVARLLSNGTPDSSFDGDGRQTIPFDLGGSWADVGEALAIQNDGKIVIAGEAAQSGASSMAFTRLLSSGARDSSFGSNGKQTYSFTSKSDRATGLAITSGGKIIAGGYAGSGSTNPNFAALRLNANGSLDTSYGTGGKTQVDFALQTYSDDLAYDLVLQSGGEAFLVGRVRTGSGYDFGVVRLKANGQEDTGFGRHHYDFGSLFTSQDDRSYGVTLQSDGKLVAVGGSQATGQRAKAAALRIMTGYSISP